MSEQLKLYKGFDYAALKDIAKNANNQQIIRDVEYGKLLNHVSPANMYCERINDMAFIIGQVQKERFRIIGMGTKEAHKRKGLAGYLLNRCIQFSKERGLKKIATRSKSGADFYCKRGFDVVGMRGGDYLLELSIETK